MTLERVRTILANFERAVKRLEEALDEDILKSPVIIDGVIRRFEFSFELGWKLLKTYLAYQGIKSGSPRRSIKEAFKLGLLDDGDGWIDMLEDRNRTTHIYEERVALEILGKIRNSHFSLLEALGPVLASELVSSPGDEREPG